MAGSKSYELAYNELKKNPKVDYAGVKKVADRRGLKMAPVIYGRAKLALGLSKPGARKAKAARKAVARTETRRGRKPGRRPAHRGGSLEVLLDRLRRSDAVETALDKIRSILDAI